MGVQIYVMTHKKFTEPNDEIYFPLHVGKKEGPELGYCGDDTGISISEKNKYYGELTGLYWIWKNQIKADYIGICHYRRYFFNDQRKPLSEKEYEFILKNHDIIVPKCMKADRCYQEYYGEAHNVRDLLMVGEVIREKYPEYSPFFTSALAGKEYYYGNLFVTSKENFEAYSEWLFDILFEVEKRIDISSYDLYNQRVFGFLSEQLLKVWIGANGLRAYEGTVGITGEKAETVEFKLAMAQLVKQREIMQARELFYSYLKLRPDVRLELSDLKGEIPIIEQILYICEQELSQGIRGMLDYSVNLSELVAHHRQVLEILLRFSEGKELPMDTTYLRDTGVSWIQVKVILLNPPTGKEIETAELKQHLRKVFDEEQMEMI